MPISFMLYLIGLGLNDENDITLKGLKIARKSTCFAELYTNNWQGSLENLETLVNKKITNLKREDLEEKLEDFVDQARENDIALFVSGDPLVATTHVNVVLEAKKRKIPVKIIHNASIYSAIAETGLQIYKFGKTATIAFSGSLDNVKNTVASNRKRGLHTLLLLDLDKEVNLFMKVKDALNMLLKKKIVKQTSMLISFSRAGGESEIFYDSVKGLLWRDIKEPAVIIIPGKLHFVEKEFLEMV